MSKYEGGGGRISPSGVSPKWVESKRHNSNNFDISSSYAKLLGETNFHTREFPRSGSKAKDIIKKIIYQ